MRELGDFQTPPALVAAVLARLGPIGTRWPRVLEPTCGRGHFLAGLLALDPPPREIAGFELQAGHLAAAQAVAATASAGVSVRLEQADLFAVDLAQTPRWSGRGPLLVVGNPPWVTSAELGALGSSNHPKKHNLHGDRGLDARTGASNFDLAEAVWIKLLRELAGEPEPVTLALLCKVSVARRILGFLARAGQDQGVVDASIVRLDARRWFGASVDACLFRLTMGPSLASSAWSIPVYPSLEADTPEATIGLRRGRLVGDAAAYEPLAYADGTSPCLWRQGVKHDAAGVMELDRSDDGRWRNRAGEVVEVEPEHVAPLLKGTDLARGDRLDRPNRAVLVTQRRVGDDTRILADTAPRLWAYLRRHDAAMAARRSSVYRGRPPYVMFGIGPYTFAPYKVAVSGLHRGPRFRVLGPVDGRPVLLDDTCYFVACQTPERAALLGTLANRPEATGLLAALGGIGSKRTVTKALLQRLDLRAVFERADRPALLAAAAVEVERLTGRAPRWPDAPDSLLESDGPS